MHYKTDALLAPTLLSDIFCNFFSRFYYSSRFSSQTVLFILSQVTCYIILMNLRPYRPIRGGRDCVGEKFNHFYSLQMSNQNNTNVTTENAAMDESFKRHSPFSEAVTFTIQKN